VFLSNRLFRSRNVFIFEGGEHRISNKYGSVTPLKQ
jgi:hypothetical protein